MKAYPKPRNNLVTQGNELIEACQKLRLNEKRILLLGISKINPRRKTAESLRFSITVRDWLEYFPEDAKPWRTLREGQKDLMKRGVIFRDKTALKHPSREIYVNWFDSAVFNHDDCSIDVIFGPSMSFYLFEQISRFASISLQELTSLRSLYSIRLYEQLMQYKYLGVLKISVEDFRHSMGCDYPRMESLKNRVLIPAVEEINAKTPMEVKFSQVKHGCTITHFVFNFVAEQRKCKALEYDDKPQNQGTFVDNKGKGFANTSTRGRSLADDMNDVSWVG